MCKSIEGVTGTPGKILDWSRWAANILVPVVLAVVGWAWLNHEDRINGNAAAVQAVVIAQKVMDGDRFKAQDGLDVWKAIAAMQERLDSKADAIGAVPVRDDIQEIRRRLESLERSVP